MLEKATPKTPVKQPYGESKNKTVDLKIVSPDAKKTRYDRSARICLRRLVCVLSHCCSFSLYLSDEDMRKEIKMALHGKKGDKWIVNPYLVPSPKATLNLFFKQIEKIPRLAVLAEEYEVEGVDKYEAYEHTSRRFYELIGGEPSEEKEGVIEECLMEFRKCLVNRRANKNLIGRACTVSKKKSLYQLNARIVKVMYYQLFMELRKKGINYHHEDFGVGTNENFRFEKFYREDHSDLF